MDATLITAALTSLDFFVAARRARSRTQRHPALVIHFVLRVVCLAVIGLRARGLKWLLDRLGIE